MNELTWDLPPPDLTGAPSAADLDTLERLRRAVELAEGFALLFARYDLPTQRDDLVARLAAGLERQGVAARRLEVAPPAEGFLAGLRAACEPVRGRGCLLVCGLDQLMPAGDPHPPVLGQLNLARDRFRDLPCPVVFWLRDEALTRLARGAPDFWAWRSGVFEFGPAGSLPETPAQAARSEADRRAEATRLRQADELIHALEGLLAGYRRLPQGPIEQRARASLLVDLADLYQTTHRPQTAQARLTEALPLLRRLDDPALRAHAQAVLRSLEEKDLTP